MKNGISANLGTPVKALLLAASMLLAGGCETQAPTQSLAEARDVRESPSYASRHRVDAARNRIWSLGSDGVQLQDAGAPQAIRIALPGWLWVGAPYSCMPDLALGPNGEAVITSNIIPTLWRIDPETLAVSVHPLALDADTEKDVGFSGLAYSARHAAFFAASDINGSLWQIDPRLRRAQKITLSAPIRQACGLAAKPDLYRPA